MTDEILSWEDWLALIEAPPDWLIPGILERGGGGLIHGPSQSYKSFFFLRLCLDLASGQPVMDIWPLSRSYRTLLLQAEGSKHAWHRRMIALKGQYPPKIPFWSIHTLKTRLDTKAGSELMEIALGLCEPDLIVIDPIANFFTGSSTDEPDVKRWVETINAYRETGCAVLLGGHDRQTIREPKRGGGTTAVDLGMYESKGIINLPAWADFVAGFRKSGTTTTMTIQKVRDDIAGAEFYFTLEAGRLVFSGRSDALEALIHTHIAQGTDMRARLTEAVAADANAHKKTVERLLKKMIEDGRLTETPSGIGHRLATPSA